MPPFLVTRSESATTQTIALTGIFKEDVMKWRSSISGVTALPSYTCKTQPPPLLFLVFVAHPSFFIYLFYSLVVTRISLHLSSAIHVLHCCYRAIRLKFHGKALLHPPRACVGVCVSPRSPRRRRFVPPPPTAALHTVPHGFFFFFLSVAAATASAKTVKMGRVGAAFAALALAGESARAFVPSVGTAVS